ncbi:hypothetical protein CLROS_013180 [Clostridium felsineum]|uniref:Uncharacterized protein n=1 Tax=Clostridium felsineum TaxID=36839 RepID=A0A9Q8XDN4_9CLOT|nr:hypothetical protein CLROS_013180 [Clostridium felsineum]URZ11023.1 hypothetical protein CROST_017390 [Clostridium felsineum]
MTVFVPPVTKDLLFVYLQTFLFVNKYKGDVY